jgi:hypothetical protein
MIARISPIPLRQIVVKWQAPLGTTSNSDVDRGQGWKRILLVLAGDG